MKILFVADEECPALWEYYVPGKLKPYDLISRMLPHGHDSSSKMCG